MNSFYFFPGLLLFFSCFGGYRAGLIRQIFYSLIAAVSLTAAYFLHTTLIGFIDDHFSLDIQSISVLIFCLCFLILFMLVGFIGEPILKKCSHKHPVNKIAGAISFALLASVFMLETNQLPPKIKTAFVASPTGEEWMITRNWIGEKIIAISNSPSGKVMSIAAEDSVHHTAEMLPYCNDKFCERPDLEAQMLEMINAERVKVGLNVLLSDEDMRQVARAHSGDMFQRGYFSHDTPDGIDPFQRIRNAGIRYRFAGENLAMSATLIKAHINLMKSPGHKANILKPSFGRVGIGILDGGKHGLMISQEFRD